MTSRCGMCRKYFDSKVQANPDLWRFRTTGLFPRLGGLHLCEDCVIQQLKNSVRVVETSRRYLDLLNAISETSDSATHKKLTAAYDEWVAAMNEVS